MSATPFFKALATLFVLSLPFSPLARGTAPDPAGDAVGNGSLVLPTAPVYRKNAFDLLDVTLQDAPDLALDVTMASLDNPWRLPNGFSLPVIEIYLDTDAGTDEGAGRTELLHGEAGSRMSLPAGAAWDYAFYITGDAFRVFSSGDGEPEEITGDVGATLAVEGNTLHLVTNLPRPARADLYAVVGSYDPLTESGWRPVTRTPSPGTLSSPTQVVRAVDVLADTWEAQEGAINSGALPRPARRATSNDGWLLLSAAGLLLSFIGIGLRLWTRRRRTSPTPVEAPLLETPMWVPEDGTAPQEPIIQETVQEPALQEATQDTLSREHVLQEHAPVPVKEQEPPAAPSPSPLKPTDGIPLLELPLYTPTIVGASSNLNVRKPLAEMPEVPGTEAPATPEVPTPLEAAPAAPPPPHRDASHDPLNTFRATLNDEPPDSDWLIWSESGSEARNRTRRMKKE